MVMVTSALHPGPGKIKSASGIEKETLVPLPCWARGKNPLFR
jgi:hypothetical protein